MNPAETLTLTSSAFSTNFLAGQSRVGIKIDGLGSVENGPSYTSSTTTWTIPAGTLTAGRNYNAIVEFDRMVDLQSPILSGVAFAAYMTVTEFTIQAVTPQTPSLTAQPANQTVVAGQGASFTAAASGNPAPTFQWQVSTDGGTTWTDLVEGSPYAGVTADTLSITGATPAMGGYQYRCVATNSAGSATSAPANLTVRLSAADFNGDGQIDILWQNLDTGQRGVWLMHGTTVLGYVSLLDVPAPWQIAGTGDFDGDGQTDILWQNLDTGQRGVWLMHGTTVLGYVALPDVPAPWASTVGQG